MGIISSKTVKTRKEHHCFGCGRKMPKGTEMEAITFTDGGIIDTERWCNVCMDYWNEHKQFGDEIGYGELKSEDPEGWEAIRKQVEGVLPSGKSTCYCI